MFYMLSFAFVCTVSFYKANKAYSGLSMSPFLHLYVWQQDPMKIYWVNCNILTDQTSTGISNSFLLENAKLCPSKWWDFHTLCLPN